MSEADSGTSDYWDLDSIIADQQKVPCFFKSDVPGLGFLEGNLDNDLNKDNRIDLYFWLAQPLAMGNYVDMELPACFHERVRNDLNASAVAVDIKQLSPYFYKIGTNIVQLTGNTPELNLTGILNQALIERISTIVDHAETAKTSNRADQTKFLMSLDETEREIYKLARTSMSSVDMWMTRRKSMARLRKADSLKNK